MSKVRQACAVAVLTAVLAAPALAGIMDSPGVAAPTPPPSATPTTSTSITTTLILTILSLTR